MSAMFGASQRHALGRFYTLQRLLAQNSKLKVNTGVVRFASHGGPSVESLDPNFPNAQKLNEALLERIANQTWKEYLFDEGWKRPLPTEEGGIPRDDWYTMGGFPYDEYRDWAAWHVVHFGFALIIVYFYFNLVQRPDAPNFSNWARAEAFLDLERREKAGLTLISPDLIDPEKVKLSLPSDEELGDYPVII